MTLPSSCTFARRAVMYALANVTGKPRCLASDYLFRLTGPAQATKNAADMKKRPGAFVLFRDAALDGEMENGSSIVVNYTVQITCWYYAGSDALPAKLDSETDKALERIEGDEHRLRAALCYPGALDLYGSDDTGLCGQALRDEQWRAAGPDPMGPDENGDRLLRVIHTFRASVDQLQPT